MNRIFTKFKDFIIESNSIIIPINETRVPKSERVELYKDDNIIVVVPLTHRALQKYAHKCQWCINTDKSEWVDYHQGRSVIIIQRKLSNPKMGITGNSTAEEIYTLNKWIEGDWDRESVEDTLQYKFKNDKQRKLYYETLGRDITDFETNIVYYSPENGVYDMQDNHLANYNLEISDIPNVTPEVINTIDEYLIENEVLVESNTSIDNKFAYHVTRKTNIKSIMMNGLEPRIPEDYGTDGDVKGVYLFKTLDDVENALYNWLGERIEEIEEETGIDYDEQVLKIDISGLEEHLIDSVEYEWTCLVKIDPSRIIEIFKM